MFYTLLEHSKFLLKKKNNSFASLPRCWFRKQISMYLTCFLFRFLSVSHTSTLSHHPHTSKPPSFSLYSIQTHNSDRPNLVLRPKLIKTRQNRPKFNLRWNKWDYHSGLYASTRFSSWNEMDLITLVFGMGWWSPLDESMHDSFTP